MVDNCKHDISVTVFYADQRVQLNNWTVFLVIIIMEGKGKYSKYLNKFQAELQSVQCGHLSLISNHFCYVSRVWDTWVGTQEIV